MDVKIYYWTGFCNADRTLAIDELGRIIGESAIMVNFQFFSDISIGVTIETEESRLPELYIALKKSVHLENALPIKTDSEKECIIMLNITFVNNSGNFKTVVPPIPG